MEDEHELSPEEIQKKEALRAQIRSYFREGDKYDYYEIPVGTELFSGYRGTLNSYKFKKAISQPKFFGFNKETAEIYGYVFAYITTRHYKLIAMDSLKTLGYLYSISNKEIQNILRRNYGYDEKKIADAHRSGKKFIQIRTSTKSTDFKLVQYLCTQGFSGYATNFMKEDFDGTFHPECAICTPIGVELNPDYYYNGKLGLATPDSEVIRKNVEELALKDSQLKTTEEHTGTKRRTSIFDLPPRMGSSSLFGESPPRMGSSSLFADVESPPRMGSSSLFADVESPPKIGSSSLFGPGSPPRTPPRTPDNNSNKKGKYGGKTRKQKRNASKKGIKSLRNKSYNNVRRRKVSNRRN